MKNTSCAIREESPQFASICGELRTRVTMRSGPAVRIERCLGEGDAGSVPEGALKKMVPCGAVPRPDGAPPNGATGDTESVTATGSAVCSKITHY